MLTLTHFLILSGALLAIGLAGVFVNRRHVLVLLMSIELILLAVNTNFLAIAHYLPDRSGQVFVFFILAVAAAEVAVGLAIVVTLFRNRATLAIDDLRESRG